MDQRRYEAFVQTMHMGGSSFAGSPSFGVAHVPLAKLVDAAQTTDLVGEMERDGMIDGETLKRIACYATIAVAVDDDVGQTMYEGQARRFPTDAQRREVMRRDRHCRFPGCSNGIFTESITSCRGSRVVPLIFRNLALLCRHHHGVVHRNGWTMTGNANEELTFVGPSGRVMTSPPSQRWGVVTAQR